MQLRPGQGLRLEKLHELRLVAVEAHADHGELRRAVLRLEFADLREIHLAGLAVGGPVVNEHRHPLERRHRHLLAIDGRPGERERLAHALEPLHGTGRLPRLRRVGEGGGDRGIPLHRLGVASLELVAERQLQEGLGRLRRLRIGVREGLQVFEPGLLQSLAVGARLLHARRIFRLDEPERDEGRRGVVSLHCRGDLLELGDAVRKQPFLHVGRERLDELVRPEALVGVGRSGDELLEHADLLRRKPLASRRVGRRHLALDLPELGQQRLEVLGHVAGAARGRPPARGPRRQEAEGLADAPGNLRGIDGTPGVAALHERPDEHLAVALLALHQRHDVVVGRHVLRQARRARGQRARGLRREHAGPAGVGGHVLLIRRSLGERRGGGRDSREQVGEQFALEAGGLEVGLGGQQPGERRGIAVAEGADNLRRGLLGREHLPGVDHAVGVRVGAPAAAGTSQPAILVGLGVFVGIEFAIHLHAVLVVAPAIDDPVAIAVGKRPQHLARRTADDQSHHAPFLLLLDRGLLGLGVAGLGELDPLLPGLEGEGVGGRRGRRERGHGQGGEGEGDDAGDAAVGRHDGNSWRE